MPFVAARWKGAGTAAYAPAPDGSIVPVGFFWATVRSCIDNDIATRLNAFLRVPPTSVDGVMQMFGSARRVTAHGYDASILAWMPRLGLLLASRRIPAARALLAATWREWQEALTAAAGAARKDQKNMGITPSWVRTCEKCNKVHASGEPCGKRARDEPTPE
jgi:hypothetical protein